ncbi:MFS transporter [Pandoraea sputorum]|uniref:MFS transporter n=1 Tax=Pandoraea sputorum TaxID=93222 RepID=UPI001241B686|nr:MFS transporter [Pandoraea sputorum]VVE59557.1 hypothetical protein PSP20601_05571 [Pandoraea sputorum]
MNARALFKVPGYPLLLTTAAASSIILWVDFTLMFSTLSYDWHAASTTVGLASALYGLPGLILGPWFGRLADRSDALTVLMLSYVARGTTSLLLMFAPNAPLFVLLIFVKGLSNLGAMPAEQILIRSVLTREQLASNASLMTLIDQVIKIAAPLLAAAFSLSSRPGSGFGLSCALALVGLLCLVALRSQRRRSDTSPPTDIPLGVSPLLTLWKSQPEFRVTFLAVLIQCAVLGLYDPLLALFLRGRGFPASTFGMIVSFTAAGAIVGAALFKRYLSGCAARGLTSHALIAFGLTVAIPGVLATAQVPIAYEVLLILWAVNGCAYALTAMSFRVTMQTACPQTSLGAVSATARSAQLAMLVLGPLIGSSVARIVGIPIVFSLSGLLAMLAGVLAVVQSRKGSESLPG